MNVPSFEFLVFAGVVAVTIFGSPSPVRRRTVLLIANLAFVATFASDLRLLAPFAGFVIAGYLAIGFVRRTRRRLAFATVVVAFVMAFCAFKRYTFLPPVLDLPSLYQTVGVSYVFFRVLHLVIDAFQGSIEAPIPLAGYLNYVLNFTTLVAGPIQLYPEYLRSESGDPPPLDLAIAARAVERIALGFAKVVVFAPIFSSLQTLWVSTALVDSQPALVLESTGALLAYPIFLYLNFSGYTDFVIGVARFLRIELPENFNSPFVARGFIDFWSRWHMTLSGWLKTYVYSPLFLVLLRRFPNPRAEAPLGVLAFFVTFFLVGLWHGSTNMFVVYGLLQGLGTSANKAFQLAMIAKVGRKRYRELSDRPAFRTLSRGLTYEYFAISLLWFAYSADRLQALALRLGPGGILAVVSLGAIGSAVGIAAAMRVSAAMRRALAFAAARASTMRFARIGWTTALLVAVATTNVVVNDSTPKIVYKAF